MTDDVRKKIDDFARDIGEHCDSVRIFCTAPEGDGETSLYSVGNGNWHAQYGAVKEWIVRTEERTRIEARNDDQS